VHITQPVSQQANPDQLNFICAKPVRTGMALSLRANAEVSMMWVKPVIGDSTYIELQKLGIKRYFMKNAVALSILLAAVSGAGFADDSQLLIQDCDGCHGPAGASTEADVPVIGGQSEASIEKALMQFQNWDRPCTKSAYRHGDTARRPVNMCELSEGLSGEDVRSLAAHYSSQPFIPAKQDFDESRAMEGASLHTLYCITCHPKGGSEAGYAGRLAGQWKPYLRSSIKNISTGEWLVPKIMARKMSSFSEQEIEALLDYFASQQD
jgi:sulfide dehydrogenase cytochrome subunit